MTAPLFSVILEYVAYLMCAYGERDIIQDSGSCVVGSSPTSAPFSIDNLNVLAYIINCQCINTQHDPLAQLGERHLDRVEVTGSNPVRVIT